MSRSITLGQYLPGESPLHRLDPRFKLINLFVLLVILFWIKTFSGLGFLAAFLLVLAFMIRVPVRYILRGLRPIMYLVIFTLVIYLFFTKGGVVLFRLGPLTVESAGVIEGTFIVIRLLLLVLMTLLLTLTTTPLSLTYGLENFLKPLRLVRVPVAEIAMIMTIALRFIPTLMEESRRIMLAQMARGADFESGSIFRRALNLTPLVVPLFVSAFRRAEELATAMEARGYRVGMPRTRMHEYTAGLRDWISLALCLSLFVATIFTGA